MSQQLPHTAFVLLFKALLVVCGLNSVSVLAHTYTAAERDYIIPGEQHKKSRVKSLGIGSTVAPCTDCGGNPVEYTTFMGETLQMFEYPGRYVNVLAPREWPDTNFPDRAGIIFAARPPRRPVSAFC